MSGTSLLAFPSRQDSTVTSRQDTTTAIIGVTDSLAAALQSAFTDTTEVKVRDRGFDASKYKMMKRYQPKDQVKFVSDYFSDNTFYQIRASSLKLAAPDYSFGIVAGFNFGKWFHEDHALRLNLSGGHWYDNFNGHGILSGELTMSYLFNVASYLGGYIPKRFCEFSVVAGGGYAVSGYTENWGHALTGHVGVNIDMKLSSVVSFFVEPLAKIYSNGMAVSRAGNWRSWLSAFEGSTGLSFELVPTKVEMPKKKWFISILAGPQLQNSANVYDKVGLLHALGFNANLAVGQYFTDYFALRGTLSYSRHNWVRYDELLLYSHYYSVRAEGMFDFVEAFSKNEHHHLTFAILAGPEFGYMYKDDYGEEYISAPYIGLTAGAQLRFFLAPKLKLFFEPRFSLVPYMAKSYDKTTLNDFVNYYDGVINMNLGLEIDL